MAVKTVGQGSKVAYVSIVHQRINKYSDSYNCIWGSDHSDFRIESIMEVDGVRIEATDIDMWPPSEKEASATAEFHFICRSDVFPVTKTLNFYYPGESKIDIFGRDKGSKEELGYGGHKIVIMGDEFCRNSGYYEAAKQDYESYDTWSDEDGFCSGNSYENALKRGIVKIFK